MIESSPMLGARGTNHLEALRSRMDLLQRVVVEFTVSGQDTGATTATAKPQFPMSSVAVGIDDADNPAAGSRLAPESTAQVSQPSIPIGRSTAEFAASTQATPGQQPPGRGVVRDLLNRLFGL